MRVDVKKHLVLGPLSVRTRFFQRIQELGIVEFISYEPRSLENPLEIQNLIDALHVLRQMVPVEETPDKDYHSASVLAHHIIERKHELEKLAERKRVLESDRARVSVFGDFSVHRLHEVEKESGRVIQFFFAKNSEELEAPQRPEVIYVGSAYGLDYFVAINKERASYEGLIEIVIERSIGELEVELAHINREIDIFETELARLAHNKKLLKQGLIDALNRHHLEASIERVDSLLDGDLFAVEGWVPANKIHLLGGLAQELDVVIEPIAVEPRDKVPTYLENKGPARLGEDLVGIYDTPSNQDRDPSLWVFIAFGVFFSMILADAGYGLLLLLGALFLRFKFKKKHGLGGRVIRLATWLSIGCIFWGLMLSSFFGIELKPDNPIRKISLIHWMVKQKASYFLEMKPGSYDELVAEYPKLKEAKTPMELLTLVKHEQEGMSSYVIYQDFTNNVLIELAIFIGTIHIILSFLRYLDRNWAGAGWVVFMVGSYLYFPLILGAVSLIHYIFHIPYQMGGDIGHYILFGGLGLTVALALIQHRLRGIGEIMQVIGVFADVMSYLRIYALSLAGMIMASTFNQIGTSMPLYIGIFIILAGHTINLTLALMGGVIHGLRLNFIEWYHYSFDGGGRQFNPLELIKID